MTPLMRLGSSLQIKCLFSLAAHIEYALPAINSITNLQHGMGTSHRPVPDFFGLPAVENRDAPRG